VHNHLWIAVDMWKTPETLAQVRSIASNYATRFHEAGKTVPIDPVELGRAQS